MRWLLLLIATAGLARADGIADRARLTLTTAQKQKAVASGPLKARISASSSDQRTVDQSSVNQDRTTSGGAASSICQGASCSGDKPHL